jgi:hypothetical protein
MLQWLKKAIGKAGREARARHLRGGGAMMEQVEGRVLMSATLAGADVGSGDPSVAYQRPMESLSLNYTKITFYSAPTGR